MRRRSKLVLGLAFVVAVVLGVAYAVVGHELFDKNHGDALRHADAIVVLGGEHDGREAYGLKLAHEGYARTVLISDPYPSNDPTMQQVCHSTDDIEVICFAPKPSTTRGEAMFTQRMALQRGWSKVIVVSWRFHLVRARYIFGQCFGGATVMRAVPRGYSRNPFNRIYTYSYQFGGLGKAFVLGCDRGGARGDQVRELS